MSKYALNISDDGRVLSATYEEYAGPNSVIVNFLPEGDISEYKYINGKYIHDPLPEPEIEPRSEITVTTDDILNTLLGVTE